MSYRPLSYQTYFGTNPGTLLGPTVFTVMVTAAIVVTSATDKVTITVDVNLMGTVPTITTFQTLVDAVIENSDAISSLSAATLAPYGRTFVVTGLTPGPHTITLQGETSAAAVFTGNQTTSAAAGPDTITAVVSSS